MYLYVSGLTNTDDVTKAHESNNTCDLVSDLTEICDEDFFESDGEEEFEFVEPMVFDLVKHVYAHFLIMYFVFDFGYQIILNSIAHIYNGLNVWVGPLAYLISTLRTGLDFVLPIWAWKSEKKFRIPEQS